LVLFAAAAQADAGSAAIHPELNQRIVEAAKQGPTTLAHFVDRVRYKQVGLDFNRALEIAQNACLNDATTRGTSVPAASTQPASPCYGYVAKTFIVEKEAYPMVAKNAATSSGS
jgi:hypothetical protein